MLLYYLAALFKGLQPRVDDDFVDKLNYHYTTAIIFAFAIIVSAKQYVGYPIQCWVPAQFTDAWEQYTENYCWVQNTYFLPLTDPMPMEPMVRHQRKIGYYQWVPFVLAIEALLFYIPCAIWRGVLHWYSGVNVQGLAEMAAESRMMERDSRTAHIHTIANHLEDALEIQKEIGSKDSCLRCIPCTRRCGAYVTALYLFVKALYLGNLVGQLFLLNHFLGTNNLMYGFDILLDLIRGTQWYESGYFPRVTMCDFEVRAMGNVHHYTVQCVLMINLFNEKIYLFLWFWFLVVALVTGLSLVHWIVITVVPNQRERFVRKYLRAADVFTDRNSVKKFTKKYLSYDGVFSLRMIAAHAGDIVTTELAHTMWGDFHEQGRKSPIEAMEGPTISLSSQAQAGAHLGNSLNIKEWLLGHHMPHQHNLVDKSGAFDTSAQRRKNKRRKSDGYFSFV